MQIRNNFLFYLIFNLRENITHAVNYFNKYVNLYIQKESEIYLRELKPDSKYLLQVRSLNHLQWGNPISTYNPISAQFLKAILTY